MGIYRTALLVAVSHANMDRHSNQNINSNHTWTSLTSGASNNPEYYINTNYYNYTSYRDRGLKNDLYEFHGNVNVLLGGAMLFVISTIVCLICYCCHRKSKMRSSLYMQHHRWFDSDYNMEVYSVEQYYDMTASIHDHDDSFAMIRNVNERPPSYECIMALNEALGRHQKVAPALNLNRELADVEVVNSKTSTVDVNGNIIQCDNNNNAEQPRPTTSSSSSSTNENEVNGNNEEDDNGNWDIARANGIVKLDMSKIMDQTGLPTYEAALTLKSSNYI
ncbi:hypothetical protein PVAND_008591 [Polypedilum vanderplanki]|uniref:Uncharacterized protein n=1 Tax=Polypedilum vanderplanki TaxID=319348 RepID=A0A9J6CAR0_POLVA|nr:hypothetical protein PVAND_008591 [Polypedilum vanderplanki]